MTSLIYIPPAMEDLPDIALYMDQLMEFMNRKMERLQEGSEKPLLTKTMVNNYVKHGIIKKPVKKKYTKEQVMQLLMVCHWKGVLNMEDMAIMIRSGGPDDPVEERYLRYRRICIAYHEDLKCTFDQGAPEWDRAVFHVVVSEWNRRKAREAILHLG